MGPKKGKKGNDKPKEDPALTADLRRQQRIAAKAELRRRMEDEAKNSATNSLKILNQWRKIMRLAKTEALKKDIETLSQNHERDVDRKDAILQMLDRDLEEAEDQYQMALRTHLVNVDELIKLHDSRLYALERSFQQELAVMQADFNKEKEYMSEKFKQEKKELSAIIDAIEQEEEDRDAEQKHSFQQLREEIGTRNRDEINMLRVSLDAQIEELEQHFETAHLNYLQQTAQRTHDFKELTQRDQKTTHDIETYRKRIDALQTTIQQWRAKIKQLNRETEERSRLLLEEKHSIQRHYQQLKQRIQVYRGTQNQSLLHLSESANKCKEDLKEKLALARRILQVSELARKMETIHEQVQPFIPPDPEAAAAEEKPNTPGTAEPPASSSARTRAGSSATGAVHTHGHAGANARGPPPAYQSSVWSEDGQYISASDRLANFYRKFNKVLLDNIAIEKEKERLAHENAQLQDLIQQYLSGTKLTEDTLTSDNPLFVVNGRANLNSVPPVRQIPNTKQEAAQIRSTVVRQVGPTRAW